MPENGFSLEPSSSFAQKINKSSRYNDRVLAQDRLKRLEIMDFSRSPQSVLGHGLLTMNNSHVTTMLFADINSPRSPLIGGTNKDHRRRKMDSLPTYIKR